VNKFRMAVLILCLCASGDALGSDWFKGTYTVEIDGRVVGSEEFKFRTSESGSLYASAKVEGKHAQVTTNLELESDGTFRKYKDFVLLGTRRKGAIGFPHKGGIRFVRDKETRGKDIDDLTPGEGFVILHSRVFHLYGELSRRHLLGPASSTYSVLWADSHSVGTVQVSAIGPASLMKNDRTVALTALEVRGEGINVVVLVDEEGRPHRIEDGRHVVTLRGYKKAFGAAPAPPAEVPAPVEEPAPIEKPAPESPVESAPSPVDAAAAPDVEE